MDKIKKSIRVSLIFAILTSIMLVAGIFLIIFFAGKLPLLMILGIVSVVVGFYGSPMIWVSYGQKIKLKRMLELIENENIYSIDELGAQLGINSASSLEMVRSLINKGYLIKYLLIDNKYLKLNENKKQEKRTIMCRCPGCGAKTYISGQQGVCEYCGNIIENII